MNEKRDIFIEQWDHYRGQLFGYIFSVVQNLADAEDVFQQTSLALWNKFDQKISGEDFLRWSCTVAKNKAIDHLRNQKRDRHWFSESLLEQLATMQSTVTESNNVERTSALNHCIEKLSGKDQKLIRLCYTEDVVIKNVAQEIDRPVGAVYDSLSRIRRVLFHCINRVLSRESG